MDEAQALLRVGLLETGADQVFERDDGGLVRMGNIEKNIVYRGGEADGQEERRRAIGLRWSRGRGGMMAEEFGGRAVVVGWRHCDGGKASVMRSVWRGRGGAVCAPASAHLVDDDVDCRVGGTILRFALTDCDVECCDGMQFTCKRNESACRFYWSTRPLISLCSDRGESYCVSF